MCHHPISLQKNHNRISTQQKIWTLQFYSVTTTMCANVSCVWEQKKRESQLYIYWIFYLPLKPYTVFNRLYMQQAIIIFVYFPEQVPLQQSNIMGYTYNNIHCCCHYIAYLKTCLLRRLCTFTLESNATTRTGAYESLLSIAIKPFFYAHCM